MDDAVRPRLTVAPVVVCRIRAILTRDTGMGIGSVNARGVPGGENRAMPGGAAQRRM
jgi:hypothetical protein